MAAIAIIVTGAVLAPICAEAGTTTVDIENEGVRCSKITAGYSATAEAATTEQYALIGETVTIVRTAGNLHAFGIGIDETAEEFAIAFDGSSLTIGTAVVPCAWAFVPDESGTYRYGAEGKAQSIDDVYGAGIYEGVYYSIAGADEVKVGVVA